MVFGARSTCGRGYMANTGLWDYEETRPGREKEVDGSLSSLPPESVRLVISYDNDRGRCGRCHGETTSHHFRFPEEFKRCPMCINCLQSGYDFDFFAGAPPEFFQCRRCQKFVANGGKNWVYGKKRWPMCLGCKKMEDSENR
uniref:Uncharacterized protein n=1 Tax=Lotharella oceanica TaxID=641309 RepID=A0A7S2TIJ2_9EUKA|mmetsp:Transcript_13235/g.25348  ORF Transcript_13235/g.25348 Transcript_13235/m.25348 type:complete len:142 (+) Transcript_13235:16-441(+)